MNRYESLNGGEGSACLPTLQRFNEHPIPALRQCTHTQLGRFADCVSETSLQRPAPGVRRECPYSLRRTFWRFIWQMLNFNTSCPRLAVSQRCSFFQSVMFPLKFRNYIALPHGKMLPGNSFP